MQHAFLKKTLLSVFAIFLLGDVYAQFEEGKQDPYQAIIIQGNTANTYAPVTLTILPPIDQNPKKIQNIIRFKINEQAYTSNATNAPLVYFKSAFTAQVTVTVDAWLSASSQSATPDQSFPPTTLTVTYDPAAGAKYNPVAYWLLNNITGYEKVKLTITSPISVTNTANGWTQNDVLPLLTVENEMRVLRYFTNPTLPAPAITPTYDATYHPDQLSVSWPLPTQANTSQLEYAWVENETQGFYSVNGTFNTDKLFSLNSTRVDIDTSNQIFNIPLLFDADVAQGGGTLYYRVRSAYRKNDGNVITGDWSTPQTFAYNGHQPNMNWQSSTSFAENGKSKTVIQYFDGSLRPRQTVTKDNSTGNTTVAETIYDLQGRPNVQILPTPTMSTAIQYFSDFNRFVGQTTNDDPAKYFDLAVAGNQCVGAPQLDTTINSNSKGGNGLYYSYNNPWLGKESSANFIPDAKGYAYTETKYTDDPTQRVSVQGGVGEAFQIGKGHTTNYFYGKPNQSELDALFGTEVGDASHYFKNMVQDANGQMSVSYVDMHGRTIATALAGDSTVGIRDISRNTAFYPASSGQLTNQLITPSTNIIKGDSIENISTLLVPTNTAYNFTYQLTPAILQQLNCNQQQICFDCKYNLDISIRQEGCNTMPVVKHYSNLQIVPVNQACGTPMGFIGEGITTPVTQITFSQTLGIGSWVVRKTLSINDSMFRVRRDSALTAFLCKTQQAISDSVFTALSSSTNCNVLPAVRNCSACQALLGNSYATSNYKANYIASVGGTPTLSDAQIHALYTQDSLECSEACGLSMNPALSSLTVLQNQMLNDMMPYQGQYAVSIDSLKKRYGATQYTNSLISAYDIFSLSYSGNFTIYPASFPHYKLPATATNFVPAYYTDGSGSPDFNLYPGGNTSNQAVFDTLSPDGFTALFNRNWAQQLLSYHPEYGKLDFAQRNLTAAYAWQDRVLQCNSYQTAVDSGYINPTSKDPYFKINTSVPVADKNTMIGYINGTINSNQPGFSIWRIANGSVLCDSTQPAGVYSGCVTGNTYDNDGIAAAAVTTAQKDAVWQSFRSQYLSYRNEMVTAYINSQTAGSLSPAAMTELQNEGKQLRFATNADVAMQNGWTWWSAATNTTSVNPTTLANTTNAYVLANTGDKCTDQRYLWRGKLLQCEVLQNYLASQTNADTVRVNTIINLILDSMVMVCHNSIDANNPGGASNVNPALLPQTPANFEDIVNHVFTQNGIATLPGNNYFCNPYTIDYPKPYGSNPPLLVVSKGSVDTCNCKQFAGLKVSAKAAGYDTLSLTSMNQYLQLNYNDTLSQPLWQGLQQCNSHVWYSTVCYPRSGGTNSSATAKNTVSNAALFNPNDSCVSQYSSIGLSAIVTIPPFLNCGYVKPCITCDQLQAYTTAFRTLYVDYAGVPFTTNVDTGQAKQNALWARYLNYKTGFNKTANEYAATLLSCGTGTTTTTVPANLLLTNRTTQPPMGTTQPQSYTAGSTVTFDDGYSSAQDDYFQTVFDTTTNGSGGTGGSGNTTTALCALDKPVTYVALPDTTHSNPCAAVKQQADFIGQLLYQELKDSLIANFDSLYRAKCLSAQSTEIFYATYKPAEYHYTLYYYDQAGNLVKTIPPAAVKPNFDATYLTNVKAARASGTDNANLLNNDAMATQYRYNTLNAVVAQNSPDGGISNTWYDRLGRLVISQNAKQAAAGNYSYTLYDALGRKTEAGEKPQTTAMTQTISQDTMALKNWLAGGGLKEQITQTLYDVQYASGTVIYPYITQLNLRNRVSYVQAIDVENAAYRAATYYSYDVHGDADTVLQDYGANSVMGTTIGNQFKLIKYDYDIISGKVNMISYQPNKADGYYQQYQYDAENRLTMVKTSRDSIQWEHDANYQYYRHGPLARMELGELKVQGVDYTYTLQGWLKSINPSYNNISSDLYDNDGTTPLFARDAYKLNLNYYDDGIYTDYKPIGAPNGYVQGNTLPSSVRKNLYNGNISSIATNIRALNQPLLYNYQYDQLNRLVSMDAWKSNGLFAATEATPMQDFAERYTYDPNGNILSLSRNGTTANSHPLGMDNLSYKYVYVKTNNAGVGEYVPGSAIPSDVDHLTNQLASVRDAIGDANYANDIDNQSANNYSYDQIGNMIKDTSEHISEVTWSAYRKILSFKKNGSIIFYTYDVMGNRISKTAGGITTWYVRDAQGNVLSTYTQGDNTKNSGTLTQSEVHLYGSSRIGVLNSTLNCNNLSQPLQMVFTRGSKQYELSNHLGNILATISDKKLQVSIDDNQTVAYYNPDVLNANDYYSFGMLMPERAISASKYRYGFNSKEMDNEASGDGNQYDYGFRIYNPRIGKFLSVDPLAQSHPWNSTYAFAENDVIRSIDLDGLEKKVVIHWIDKTEGDGTLHISKTSVSIDQNASFDGWGKPSNASKSSGSVFALTETYYYMMSDKKLYKGKDLLENANVNDVNPPPSAQYNYTNDVIDGKLTKDAKWAGGNPAKWARLLSRDVDAPDNARTVEDISAATLAVTSVMGIPSKLRGMLGAEGVAVNGVNASVFTEKNISIVTEHLKQFGDKAENEIMLNRVNNILKGKLEATEIDKNFMAHELREQQLEASGILHDAAHEQVLKEQNMYHREYQKKLYTQEAIDAGDAQLRKEADNK